MKVTDSDMMKQWLLRSMGLIVLALAAGGCEVPAALAYKFLGPPPEPAKYAPNKEAPMVVIVENTRSTSATAPEADELAITIHDELSENKVAPMIDPAKIHALRDNSPLSFRHMSISDIGRRLGAKQVLYIDLKELDLDTPTGSDVVSLKMKSTVKMVDVATSRTLWPGNDEGEPFDYASPIMRITPEMSAAMLKRQALHLCGIDIAKMFYRHQADTMKEENQDMRLR